MIMDLGNLDVINAFSYCHNRTCKGGHNFYFTLEDQMQPGVDKL